MAPKTSDSFRLPAWLLSSPVISLFGVGAIAFAAFQTVVMSDIPKIEKRLGSHDAQLKQMIRETAKHETLEVEIKHLTSDIDRLRGDLKAVGTDIKELRRDLSNVANEEP
jgi:septal ring factor EnvC (AmiA/AmiB activator)